MAALVLALAACGGGSGTSRGRAIFQQQCSTCHTLTGHDTRSDGGDLGLPKLSVADIASFARIMPLRQPLSKADSIAVARYIRERRGGR